MPAYFNENDKFPAQWTRNLISAGFVAPGVVDERSIKEVAASDVRGATQAHFFCGISVWSYALRLAGWPDELSVFTGSCPCQGWSQAGRRRGFEDERHLWPDWFRLIKECRPAVVFGEQVSSADGLGWLDTVQADLEGAGYAFAAIDSCSAGVGAPHIRQRLYFVAYTEEFRRPEGWNARPRDGLDEAWLEFERYGDARGVADAYLARFARQSGSGGVLGAEAANAARFESADRAQPRCASDELADADRERLEGERLQLREWGPLEDRAEGEGGGGRFATGASRSPPCRCRRSSARGRRPARATTRATPRARSSTRSGR